MPATAIPATAVPTPPTCPGAANRRRWPRRSNPRLVFERLFTSGGSDAERAKHDCIQEEHSRFRRRGRQRLKSASSGAPISASSTNISPASARSSSASRGRRRKRRRAPTRRRRTTATGRHAEGLRRASAIDGRHDGAGVPGRPDARRHVRLRQRRQQSSLPQVGVSEGHHERRTTAATRRSTKRFRRSTSSTSSSCAYLLGEARRRSRKATARCWTTA